MPGKNMTVAVAPNDGDIARAESAAWAVAGSTSDYLLTCRLTGARPSRRLSDAPLARNVTDAECFKR